MKKTLKLVIFVSITSIFLFIIYNMLDQYDFVGSTELKQIEALQESDKTYYLPTYLPFEPSEVEYVDLIDGIRYTDTNTRTIIGVHSFSLSESTYSKEPTGETILLSNGDPITYFTNLENEYLYWHINDHTRIEVFILLGDNQQIYGKEEMKKIAEGIKKY